ncbi:MAG: hypothetical protein GC182_12285 [Rhodopseudomonas sp.]|nr:hypothetical protein [Rhodopseudomonas sp.]
MSKGSLGVRPFVAAIAFSVLAFAAAKAETFPARPVKIIVQTGAGSSIDVAARILAAKLTTLWGQQAVVINQPGAGGALATKALAAAAPDGETLLLAASSIFIALPEIQKARAADVDSLVPISFIGEQPMVVAVAADSKVRSFADLLALMRKTPDGLNCAVSTRGGLSHLTGEALREKSATNMNFIYYPGTAQALTDILGGRVPMGVDSLSAYIGPAAGGKIKIVAVGSAKRLARLPDVPTVAETLPGFEATAWLVLVAPKGTPAGIVDKIGADVNALLADPEVVKSLDKVGTFVRPMPTSQVKAFVTSERQKWAPIVRKFATQ